jgi:hypothetical protein
MKHLSDSTTQLDAEKQILEGLEVYLGLPSGITSTQANNDWRFGIRRHRRV